MAARLASFAASNFSNIPRSSAVARGPGSSTKQSKGGAPRLAANFATWSTANSACISSSILWDFISAGATRSRKASSQAPG